MNAPDVAALQEPPPTPLNPAARARYVTTKHSIARWEPRKMPKNWRPT